MTDKVTGGLLVLGATPIGNLADASQRLKNYLEESDLIAVEDTRMLRKLTEGLGVTPRGSVITNHDHNESARSVQILEAVQAGKTVLLLSDAGMPTISDPGYAAARAVAEAGLAVTVLPGPSAALSALAISGLPPGRFTFEGFLARKGSERSRRLRSLADEERTMIFYESPHRLPATLADFVQTFGANRRAVICRELTKLHEQVVRGRLAELADWSENTRVRGEIVLVVEGAAEPGPQPVHQLTHRVEMLVAEGHRLKDAAGQVASEHGVSKRELYQATLAAREQTHTPE